jgi:hypothetical protein
VVTRTDRRLAEAVLSQQPGAAGSHESVYRTLFVQSQGALRTELTRYLPTGRVIRRAKAVRLPDSRGAPPNTLHISLLRLAPAQVRFRRSRACLARMRAAGPRRVP